MRYLSVCSGIEAASVAWEPLGWSPVAFSEIDPFASAVLAQRFPGVPNLGSLESYADWKIEPGSVDVLVGGTPCQSFSVAGLRGGLEDARGNLALIFARLASKLRPRYVVWENVPGALSSNGGRDFGSIVGALVECGYGIAWRVLDAQYVRVELHPRAVPQRRRRIFVVGCAGADWQRAATILLEPDGVRGDSAPRREAWKETARGARSGAAGGGIAGTVAAKWAKGTGGPAGDECQNLISAPLPFDTTQVTSVLNRSNPLPGDPCHPLTRGGNSPAIAFHATQDPISGSVAPCLSREPSGAIGVAVASAVRRLTPRECERLQGFPDDWTAIAYRGKPAADGPRYKALGNSMAVNVMRWIGQRIADVDRSR